MKKPVVMFTGHREIPSANAPYIEQKLNEIICKYRNAGLFVCGGAMGFDTLAAKAVLRAKLEYGNIKLMLALPCYNQACRWPKRAREDYEIIIACADYVVYTTQGEYSDICMHIRNKFMVDMCDICVAYFTGRAGGTYSTVKYAQSRNKKIIRIKNGSCELQEELFSGV